MPDHLRNKRLPDLPGDADPDDADLIVLLSECMRNITSLKDKDALRTAVMNSLDIKPLISLG